MDNGYIPKPVLQATITDEDLRGTRGNNLIDDPNTLDLDPGPTVLQTAMVGTQTIHQSAQASALAPVPQNTSVPPVSQAAVPVPLILKGGGSGITNIKETLEGKKNNWMTWSKSMMTLFDLNDVVNFVISWVLCPDKVLRPIEP